MIISLLIIYHPGKRRKKIMTGTIGIENKEQGRKYAYETERMEFASET